MCLAEDKFYRLIDLVSQLLLDLYPQTGFLQHLWIFIFQLLTSLGRKYLHALAGLMDLSCDLFHVLEEKQQPDLQPLLVILTRLDCQMAFPQIFDLLILSFEYRRTLCHQ